MERAPLQKEQHDKLDCFCLFLKLDFSRILALQKPRELLKLTKKTYTLLLVASLSCIKGGLVILTTRLEKHTRNQLFGKFISLALLVSRGETFFENRKQCRLSSQILPNGQKLVKRLFLGGCPHFPAGYPPKCYRK